MGSHIKLVEHTVITNKPSTIIEAFEAHRNRRIINGRIEEITQGINGVKSNQ